MGPWLENGLDSDNVTLLTVPYAVHGTFNSYDTCVQSIVVEYFGSMGSSYDASCLNDYPAPDFDGSDAATQVCYSTHCVILNIWYDMLYMWMMSLSHVNE